MYVNIKHNKLSLPLFREDAIGQLKFITEKLTAHNIEPYASVLRLELVENLCSAGGKNHERSITNDNKNIPDDIFQLLRFFNVEYPNTDLDLLKRNYHRELAKYHLDKVTYLSDDLKNIANQKT
jgi:hypothetical protein